MHIQVVLYYVHHIQCFVCYFQNDFSPQNITGFGLSDGEGVERLWSNLRNFASMTKEMCSSHRIDVLSDALRHYRRKTTEKIGIHSVYKLNADEPYRSVTV